MTSSRFLPLAAATVLMGSACNSALPIDNLTAPPTNDSDGGEPEDGGAVVVPVDAGDNGAPSDTYPAPFPAPPQVNSRGGPVLDEPRFVPVFFSNDDMTLVAKAVDFSKKLGTTAYWKATTSEYGVGPATATPPVMLAETASGTIDDSKIRTWLAGKLNADDPAFPMAGTDDIYILHYPSGTTITLSDGNSVQRSCREFGAYHGDTQLDSNHGRKRVAYAVIPRCRYGSTLDTLTVSESHELVEAATDPYPRGNSAFSMVDDDHFNWVALLGGGEVSDMCQKLPDTAVRPAELGYVVQRSWSNEAALAGRDPCVPASGTYFAAAPEPVDPENPEYVSFTYAGQLFVPIGYNIPVGEKRTITLDLFSSGPTVPFTVNARNTNGGNYLSFTLDRNRGVNGEKVHLTISSNYEGPNQNASFVVTATLNSVTHNWYSVVGQAP